jgi:hypothetical protein
MAITDIHSEDRLVQRTFAEHLENVLGWESVYAYNAETFGPQSTLGRASDREVVLVRDLRAALAHLNPDLPVSFPAERGAQLGHVTGEGPCARTSVAYWLHRSAPNPATAPELHDVTRAKLLIPNRRG